MKLIPAFLWCVFCSTLQISAEVLPLKVYGSADGLANNSVKRIVSDSQGFLWVCTAEGLSRFDGFTFKNYTTEHGLPYPRINDFLETNDGDYLVASSRGLSVFNPQGKAFRWNLGEERLERNTSDPPMFRTYITPEAAQDNKILKNIGSLALDGTGTVYATATNSLYKFIKTSGDWQFEKVQFADWSKNPPEFNFLLRDSKRNLWIATSFAIYLLGNDGIIRKVNDFGGNSVFEDKSGTVWVDSGGNDIGIRIYSYRDGSVLPSLITTYTKKDGLVSNGFSNAIAQTSDGKIFAISDGIIHEFLPNQKDKTPKFRRMQNPTISSGTADNSGNIWFGTPQQGIARYLQNSFSIIEDGSDLVKAGISSISGNANNEVFFVAGKQTLFRVNGEKIESLLPRGLTGRHWFDGFLDFQSKDSEFWIPSVNGLLRYPKIEKFADLARTPPKNTYTTKDGLFGDVTSAIFEDSRGDIWISSPSATDSLIRFERSTGKLQRYTKDEGLPTANGAISFGEDSSGNIWIGFYMGEIFRFKDGKFRDMTGGARGRYSSVRRFLTDDQGKLWFSTRNRGLFRASDPNADEPLFENISTENGLSSDLTDGLVKDNFGNIYVATGRGVDRIDTEIGRIKAFNKNDGLPDRVISKAYSDSAGVLWFSSDKSLIRYAPVPETPGTRPPVFIEEISVNGKPRPVSELGEKDIKSFDLESGERQIKISFFAISFDSGENLQYEYKLNDQDWSEPSARRTLELNLAPGKYDFSVRALTTSGLTSENLATVSFTIAYPLWQRWWFITLAILTVSAAIFALDRYRVRKTEQVRAALGETQRANALIRESEIRFRTLADTASDAILTIDDQSNVVFANDAIQKVFGYTADELIGQPMTKLMPERMRGGHHSGFKRYLTTNKKNINWDGVSLPGLHKDGHEIPLEVSFGEFKREGKRYFTGIARDVSERKRAEAELQKIREDKLRELQTVRTRIATDLHDDIGSSLTQISLHSELAKQREMESGNAGESLDIISNVANELVDTMSDIVWAINPKKDHLQDLTQRMRRFAANVLTAKDIDLEFRIPEPNHEIPLGANVRREVFLIFKETVNNILKHSDATETEIDLSMENHVLVISFTDNGKGFDQNISEPQNGEDWKRFRGGNGLINMRKRAEDLGGSYSIESVPGNGTTVILSIPLEIAE